MKSLIIGFGGMGCRHAQSLLKLEESEAVYVIEPFDDVYEKNVGVIQAGDNNMLKRLDSLGELEDFIDFVVLATTADVRFKLFKEVLKKQPKTILLEKVVFQSRQQFEDAIFLAEQHQVQVLGNLPNRYSTNYQGIKESGVRILSMKVVGPAFGLLCNAVHYIDLFQFLTNSKSISHANSQGWLETQNKRGNHFIEGEGTMTFYSDHNVSLEITADSSVYNEIVVELVTGSETIRFNQTTQKGSSSSKLGRSSLSLEINFASDLTARIYKDASDGCSYLPSLQDLKLSHNALFDGIDALLATNHTHYHIT